jgi:hypothetical protein
MKETHEPARQSLDAAKWEAERDYFQAVEERFCALRGASMLLSPRDWGLIASWWREQIPLSLILETMEEVFRGRGERGDPPETIASLAYIKGQVQRRFKLHRDLVAVRRGEEESPRVRREIRMHLGRLARTLLKAADALRARGEEPLAQSLVVGAAGVRELRKSAGKGEEDPASLEARLRIIEAEIQASARAALGESDRRQLQEHAAALIKRRASLMTEPARQATLEALEEDWVRRKWRLPRISLLPQD